MNSKQRFAVDVAQVILLFGLVGCTVIGAVGSVVLTGGNPVGVLGGAVVGGVIGYGL
jgi:hypothetical protein